MPESRSIHDTGVEAAVPDEAEVGVGLLFSAGDDFVPFRKIMDSLKAAQITYDYYAAAAFRDPGGVQQWAQFAEWRRLRVIVAAAGSEPALPWLAAEASLLPVVGLPLTTEGRAPDLPGHPPRVPVLMAPRDDWQMALQMALRVLALRNARARAIVAAIHDKRADELEEQINRMFAENRDVLLRTLPQSLPPEAFNKKKDVDALLKKELKEMPESAEGAEPSARQPEADPVPVKAEGKKAVKSKSKKKSAAKDDAKATAEQEPPEVVIEEGALVAEPGNIDRDFESYKEIFMQEISRIRVEVQQTRNPDQKKFEEEARREREAGKSGAGGKETAPWRALREPGGPIEGLVAVDPEQPELEVIEAASAALLAGEVIAIPTDTVYGLAVDATNADAVRKLYDLKGREGAKAIPLLIHSLRMLEGLCPELRPEARLLAKAFWPGPLTLVVPRHAGAFDAVTRDATIGVRLPDHFVALSVISMVGRPLAVTSANPSGAEPAATAGEVGKYFGAKVRLILDAGPAPGGPVSTVVRVTEEPFEILREGKVTREQLERVVRGKMK